MLLKNKVFERRITLNSKIKGISKRILVILILSMVFVGCTPARRPINDRENVDINRDRIINNIANEDKNFPDYNPEYDLSYDSVPNNIGQNYNLEKSIKDLDGIRDVVVITDNNTAYVGVESNKVENTNNIRNLQGEIAARLREADTQIERVYVTSDRDRVERLKDFRQRITNGLPARNVINEIERLFS